MSSTALSPQETVNLWLKELASSEGVPELRLDARGLLGLRVDEALEIEIEVPAQEPLMYLRAAVMALPEQGRLACLTRLLERNFLLQDSAGAAFAIDSERNQIALSLRQPLARLDALDFINLLRGFISTALHWQEQLAQECGFDTGLQGDSDPQVIPSIRV